MSEIAQEGTPAIEVVMDDTQSIAGPSVSTCLREAREAAGLSLAEVAQSLRLGKKQIEAMETEGWKALPGITCARGFLRNYAKLLGLNPEVMLNQLDQELGYVSGVPAALEPPSAQQVVFPEHGKAIRKEWLMVGSGVGILALAVAAFFLLPNNFFSSSSQSDTATNENSATKTSTETPLFPPPSASLPMTLQVPPPVMSNVTPSTLGMSGETNTTVSSPAPVLVPPPPSAVTTTSSTVTNTPSNTALTPPPTLNPPPPAVVDTATANAPIRLSFAGDAWVEVRGKGGKSLLSQNNPNGSTKEISGEGPFALTIGNAAHVQLTYKGKAIDLTPHIKGAVARLTLE